MKRWLFRSPPEENPPPQWANQLSISPLLLKILWNRGLTSFAALEKYLESPLKFLTPPGRWPQIPDAARLLAQDLLAGKKIAVWGDYDVDGITATALTLDVLEFHGFQILYHLPDRRSEGYGLNKVHMERLARQGCETLLTVDCGIRDTESIIYANELGMKVIVTDHHLPPEELPPAAAIVDPKISADNAWPCDGLSGVGVAFYLMAMVNLLLAPHTNKKYRMDDALDLVALGTLADIMPLQGENRILTKGGLSILEKAKRPGAAALKSVSGMDMFGLVNSSQAVFKLAPRINAAGRMGDPQLALRLLRAKDYPLAQKLAQDLDACNVQRKSEEDNIYKAACKQAKTLLDEDDYAALVLCGKDWHPGIIGIVASRIVEEFHRPAIVLCEEGNFLKGSGRSWANFDLFAGLETCSSLLLNFGGHKMAAGLRIAPENLPNFRKAFSETAKKILGLHPVAPVLNIECELSFAEASNQAFIKELELMQPFGPGNPEPVFASRPLMLKKRSYLGRTGEHLLLELEELDTGRKMSAKAWRMAHELPESMTGRDMRIAFMPRIDLFNGFPTVDLGIKDWQKI